MNDFSLNRQKHKNIQRGPEKQYPNPNPENKKARLFSQAKWYF